MPGPFLIHPFAGTGKSFALLFVPDLLAEELKIQEPRRNRAATGIHAISDLDAEAFFEALREKLSRVTAEELILSAPPAAVDNTTASFRKTRGGRRMFSITRTRRG